MSDSDKEDKSIVRLYNEYNTYDENLEEIIEINRVTTSAANMEIDLENRGPLYNYLIFSRKTAISSLMTILRTDPRDAVEISRLQQEALMFGKICDHIVETMEYAKEADRFIKEEYGDDG